MALCALAALALLTTACRSPRPFPAARVGWAEPSGEVLEAGLRVRSLGRGSPTVLLLHGLAGSGRYFGAAFDVLQQDGRLVVPDLLGFGDSPRPSDADYGAQAHARAILAALDRLRVEPPIYVLAHSAGSLVALRLAALRPGDVRAIVAFGPPIYTSAAQARAHIGAQGEMVRLFAMDSFWAQLACRSMYPFSGLAARVASRIRPDLPPEIAGDAVKHSWRSYSGTVRNLILAQQPPQDLAALRIPVLIVAGTDDSLVDLAALQALDAAHEHVRLELWAGGHDLPLTEAARAVDALRRVIAESAQREH